VKHGREVVDEYTGVVSLVVLEAAHLDHDPWNPNPRLAALCRSCHARYDNSWEQRERRVHLEREKHRRLIEQWMYGDEQYEG
jgi:hypothetical protein